MIAAIIKTFNLKNERKIMEKLKDLMETIDTLDLEISELQQNKASTKNDLLHEILDKGMHHCLTVNTNRLKSEIRRSER